MSRRLRATDRQSDGPAPPVGFDPLRAGRPRTSGVMPSFKAPRGSLPAYISTSSVEGELGLWAELNPEIAEFGRVDVHKDAAKSYGLTAVTGLELCSPIRYVYDGKVRFWLPDAGARTVTGDMALFEAGVLERKSHDEMRAALAAGRDYVGPNGRIYVLLKGDMTRAWRIRALSLHLWRYAYFGPDELLADIESAWAEPRTPLSLAKQFAGRGRVQVVRHAIMKTAGDALAAGRLAIDLNRDDFTTRSEVRIRRDGGVKLPPFIRTGLPSDEDIQADQDEDEAEEQAARHIRGEQLDPGEEADLDMMREIMSKIDRKVAPARSFAAELGCTDRWVQKLHKKWVDSKHDDRVLIADGTRGDRHYSTIHERVQGRIRARIEKFPSLDGQAFFDDPRFIEFCEKVGVDVPPVRRLDHCIGLIKGGTTGGGRSPTGRARPTTAFTAGYSAVLDGRPGFLVEFDEEKTNLVAQHLPGHPATDRAHRLAMTCAGTGAPVALVPSMKAVDHGHIRQLAIRAASPKRELCRRAKTEHAWSIQAWAMVWRLDNPFVNYAHMLIRVLPKKGVYLEYAPALRPESKPNAESGFGRDQRIHEDHQPNSTKRHPSLRADLEPEQWAAEHGISPQNIEDDFVRIAVDGVLYGASDRVRTRPITKWKRGDAKYWHRTYEGDLGELAFDLKRPIGERTVSSGKISEKGRDYVQRWTQDPDTDPRNDLPHKVKRRGLPRHGTKVWPWINDDDIRTLDVYDKAGNYLVTLVDNATSMKYKAPVSQFRFAFVKELEAEEARKGTASRERSTTRVRKGNLARDKKRVARSVTTIHGIEQRNLESIRPPKASPSDVSRPRKSTSKALPVEPTFQPSPRRFEPAVIRMPPGTEPNPEVS